MAPSATHVGFFLPNRGVAVGKFSAEDHVALARQIDRDGDVDSLWIGDSIISKPRLEAIAILSALAAATRRVRLGVSCMATFVQRHPLLFALQWASVDVISAGRSILAVCMGYPADQTPEGARELRAMGVQSAERPARLVEGLTILRRLWGEEGVSHRGRFYRLDRVTLDVRPVQRPYPIFVASNPSEQRVGAAGVERALRRVARHADGWMTLLITPEEFVRRWTCIREMAREEGRPLDPRATIVFYNLNVNSNRQAAYDETAAFLGDYFGAPHVSPEMVRLWCSWGSAEECAAGVQRFVDAGAGTIIIRMCSWDQKGQIAKFLEEVLPRIHRV
ncbi:MAG: LLM class flavin-dependent oxidoreductase [Armatimonadetes bacterium]|nr:LLM class flavin-dependent oxidoreductase [Armatimonadota bacterium]